MLRCRCNDNVGKSRRVSQTTGPIRHRAGDSRGRRIEGKNAIAVKVQDRIEPPFRVGRFFRELSVRFPHFARPIEIAALHFFFAEVEISGRHIFPGPYHRLHDPFLGHSLELGRDGAPLAEEH